MAGRDDDDQSPTGRVGSHYSVAVAEAAEELFGRDSHLPQASTRRDERDLIKAVQGRPISAESRRNLDKQTKDSMAEEMVNDTAEGITFHQRLAPVLQLLPDALPQLEVRYHNLTVEVDAAIGHRDNPSLWNSTVAWVNALLLRSGASKEPLRVLDGINGVLDPGKLTLLIGPPGSGKSVLMQALSGRLQPHRGLRLTGKVEYNGTSVKDFSVQHVAGLVDQYDYHIPNMTVVETLQFAYDCLAGQKRVAMVAAELHKQLAEAEAKEAKEQSVGRLAASLEEGLAGAADTGTDAGAANGAHGPGAGAFGGVVAGGKGLPVDATRPTPFAVPGLPGAPGSEDGGSSDSDPFVDAMSRRASTASSVGTVYADAVGAPSSTGSAVAAVAPSVAAVGANDTAGEAFQRRALMKHSSAVRLVAPKPLDPSFLRQVLEVVENRMKPYLVMKVVGLSHAADTPIGDGMHRGVSGGERKRVTTAEVLVGPQRVLMMDDISTGLDSATAYSVVRSLRSAAHALGNSFLVSLLQPPPEVVRLFDDIILLTDGHVIYHGPVETVLGFFASLGFVCPPRKDPGSFLQEVTTPVGQMTYASKTLLAQRKLPEELQDPQYLILHPPTALITPVEEIAAAFWKDTTWGRNMLERLEGPALQSSAPLPKSGFANRWDYLTGMVLKRQLVLTLVRGKGFLIARSTQSVVMALIIGSLFANIQPGPDTWRNALALCVLTTIFLVMMSMPQLSMVFATKRVFFKHRDNHLFPAWSYVCGLLLTQIIPSTIESVFFCVTVYFLANFTRTASEFFTFLLLAWSTSNCLAGLFRLMAFASPSLLVANPITGLLMLLLVLTNGFTLVASSIPDYIVWIYYINPIAWTIRGLAINELMSPPWQIEGPPSMGGLTVGEYALAAFGMSTKRMYIWGSVIFAWGTLLIFTILGSLALAYLNPPKPRPTIEEAEGRQEVTRGVMATLARMTGLPARVVSAMSITGRKLSAAEVTKARGAHKVVVPFTPITLVCRDIRYYVPDPSKGKGSGRGVVSGSGDPAIEGKLRLLHGINLVSEPGQLLALMGGSGAGKTTLMDVICGRKTVGIARGDILINGHPKDQATWSRVVGYVEQTDIHSSAVTVRESLLFSGRLRLDETVSFEDVQSIVEETLKMVELDRIAERVVGDSGSGISGEQRKRLSIAVELVANPSVVFMDEPTSGLDARSANIVMRAVRNVADSQRTVMVTIHQPSLEIFEAFDAMVLLQRGGELTYFGPLGHESSALISYLEGQPGVEPIQPGYNPATWMLEVTGGSMSTTFKNAKEDFPALYKASDLYEKNLARGEELVAAGLAKHEPLHLAHHYAASSWTQRYWLIRKFWRMYWHLPEYNMTRLCLTIVIALLYGAAFFGEGKVHEDGTVDVSKVQNITGLIFSMSIFLGMFNCMSVMPLYAAEREVFYRERAASMYAPSAYTMATTVAEVPYLILQAVFMVSITYWMVGFQIVAWKFFYFLLMFFLILTMYTLFGQFLIYLTPNQLLAMLLSAAITQLWVIFNGFLLPYNSIGKGWKWMNRISPITWTLYGLACSQLCDVDVPMLDLAGQPTTLPAFLSDTFDWEFSFVWWCILIVACYVVFFRLASGLLLSKVNFLRR